MARTIRIVVIGDSHVGKSSIISSFVSNNFPENVDPVLCEVVIPGEFTTDGYSLTIVDTSSLEEDQEILCEQIKLSDVVMIVFALDDGVSFDNVSKKWIPLVTKVADDDKPIVVVGNKLDLQKNSVSINKSTHLVEKSAPLLREFPNVDCMMECSAKMNSNLKQLFYVSQRVVTFPSKPLFDKMNQCITTKLDRIIRRVFRYFDVNHDGLWDNSEMNSFQKRCYSTVLSIQEIMSIKQTLSKVNRALIHMEEEEDHRTSCITENGFIELISMFLRKERCEPVWVMLRCMGYDDKLELGMNEDINAICQDTVYEWSDEGVLLLYQICRLFDRNQDGYLSKEDLRNMFITIPESISIWDSPTSVFINPNYPENTEFDERGVSYKNFIGVMTMLLRFQTQDTLYMILYLGYSHSIKALYRPRKERSAFKQEVHCCLIGEKQVGKTSLLFRFLHRNVMKLADSDDLSPLKTYVVSVSTSEDPLHYQYCIITELAPSASDTMFEIIKSCDLCIMLFDVNRANTFDYCRNIQMQVKDKGVVFIGNKTDLLSGGVESLSNQEEIALYCKDNSIRSPVLISSHQESTTQGLLASLFEMASKPELCVPETVEERRRRRMNLLKVVGGITVIALTGGLLFYGGRTHLK